MAKYSIKDAKAKVSRSMRIIDALDDYAHTGTLELGGLKFATGENRELLTSPPGQNHVMNWFNDFGRNVLDFRRAVVAYTLLDQIEERGITSATEWTELADWGEQIVLFLAHVVERLKDTDHRVQVRGSHFELTAEEQTELREGPEKLIKRYCS